MNNKHIIINELGEIIISEGLRELFPEIMVTLEGSKIIVDNAWDKGGLQLITDATFYANTTEYLAYEILFTDSVGHITRIDNLAIRYLNKYSNLLLASPIGKDAILKIIDPLGTGDYIEYPLELEQYINGGISLLEISQNLGRTLALSYGLDIDTTIQKLEEQFAGIPIEDLAYFVEKDIAMQAIVDGICKETTDGTYDIFASSKGELIDVSIVDGEVSRIQIHTDKDINLDCLTDKIPHRDANYTTPEYLLPEYVDNELEISDYFDEAYSEEIYTIKERVG